MMRQTIGMLLQFACLVFLPMQMLWQLDFGIPLVVMPASILVCTLVFWIGTRLRESS